MLKKLFLNILSLSCLTIFSLGSYGAQAPAMVEKLFNAYDFDNIIADGYFSLDIAPQKKGKPAYITSFSYADHPIHITVHDHTLYIMADYDYLSNAPHPKVTVKLNTLKRLVVYGPTEVSSKQLPTQGLQLTAQGYGKITISNIGKLNTLEQKGNSNINIQGVNSNKLIVNASGFGKTILQGQAQQLYARLDGASMLQARNLRANKVNVQTRDSAQAYVHPLQSLRAFASQASTIYYYKQINELTSQPIQSGNVLQMAW